MRRLEPTASNFAQHLDPLGCERLWTVRDVSAFLGIPVSTLHQWRYLGQGPEAFRVGKHLRYDPTTVRTWLQENCRRVRSA
jgi:predicted DNA-binding transcriptional regulator AlpA